MKKLKRSLCMLLVCCLLPALLPAREMAFAAGSLSVEKGYVLSEGEEFEYKFTPSETGIYQVSAEGWEAEDVGRMELKTADGEWVAGRSYGMEKFFAFLEADKTYTYYHSSLMNGDDYYVLDICYYPALALSADRNAFYRRSDDDWTEFVEFTPSESGWYTFKDSGRAILYGVYAEGGVPFYDYPGTFTERGQHIYLEKGVPVILSLLLYSDTGSISVEKASFKTLKENSSVSITLEDADDGMMIDGGAFCDDYVRFTPSKSGTYKVSFTPESDKVFSWGGSFSVKDSKGTGVSSEKWNWAEKSGEYQMTAGETYYLGASAMPGGICEINAELIKAEAVNCEKHKYTSAMGDICTVCGYEFKAELIACSEILYAAASNAAVRNKPYAQAGELVYALGKGAKVEPTHYFYNSLGRKWYRLEDGNYIYSERLTDKAPKYYTISFEANGSGVNNLPDDMKIIEGRRVAIPGAVFGKPTRSGYNFLGYSTDKNADTPEYVPGKGISVTKNITLYAVWAEKGQVKLTPELKEKMDSVIGQEQKNKYCTICATATMFQRMQVYEGDLPTFAYDDIYNGGFFSRNRFDSKGSSYILSHTQVKSSSSYPKDEVVPASVADRIEYIADLLRNHPEGIVIYCNYPGSYHAILLSDVEVKENGSYQFYAYDPVNTRDNTLYYVAENGKVSAKKSKEDVGRIPLENTYLYSRLKGLDEVVGNLRNNEATGCIWYVDYSSFED